MANSLGANNKDRTETFGRAVRQLRLERGLSMEELAYQTRDKDADRSRRGLSFSYISLIERDYRRATPEVIELLARTLEVSPRQFREYRLALIRRLFDEESVGAQTATANLELFERLVEQSGPVSGEATDALSRFEEACARE